MTTATIRAEWIGSRVEVVSAPNKSQEGVKGTLVDETKNTLTIETSKGLKKVPKRGSVFTINKQKVEGDNVLVAPQDRIKLKVD